MIINNKVYYHVNKLLDWKEGEEFFVGEENTPQYMGLMSREALYQFGSGQQDVVPTSGALYAYEQYTQSGSMPDFLPPNANLNPDTLFKSASKGLNDYLMFTRELIYEEVRRDNFPHLPSRSKSFHLIPDNKGAMQFWLPKLATPEHKLFKLEVNGQIHTADINHLVTDSVSPMMMKMAASHYWMGTNQDEVSNLITFRGGVKVIGIQNIGQ